jgi:alpha-L-fucosidase 2
VLSILIVDLPLAFADTTTRTVVLGPAIPIPWVNGRVTGLRLRGSGPVDFGWDNRYGHPCGVPRSKQLTTGH